MRFVPHDYQRYHINHMITDLVLGLFLDIGLGRIVITLTAANDLRYNRFEVGKSLVIAPKKVAENTWTREVGKWDHLKLLRIIPVLSSREKRIKAPGTPGGVYMLSRDNMQWLVDHYRSAWLLDTMIIDRLSSFKNLQTKCFKSLCLVRNHTRQIYGLTDTPMPSGLLDP